jgi:hypothetical protein
MERFGFLLIHIKEEISKEEEAGRINLYWSQWSATFSSK